MKRYILVLVVRNIIPDIYLIVVSKLVSTPAKREPSPTLRPPETPPSKKTKFKLQSPINPDFSKEKDLKKLLQVKIRNIQDIRTQKLTPLQAGQFASDLAQDLLELATFQACLQEEYKYMLELSLSARSSDGRENEGTDS